MSFWSDIPAVLDADGNITRPAIPAPPPVDVAAVTPSVDDVAELNMTRTIDQGGNELGTFTDKTRPTDAQVYGIIADAMDEVLAQLPSNFDTKWYPAVSRVIALRAATQVEASFYREAMPASVPAGQWTARFLEDLSALQALIPRRVTIG